MPPEVGEGRGGTGADRETLPELHAALVDGTISALALTERALAAATSTGARLHAFTVLDPEGARQEARDRDRALAEGRDPGPLHGIPVAVKDLMSTRGLATTGGSRALAEGDAPPAHRDALLVRRLRRAGAVILGKTNLNEFAYGVTGENAHFGDSLNPWDPSRMSGGSSGGSAVAVAAGIVPAAVGTDTRGSIRIPAACCGITGFKPTRGRIPLEGVFPLSRTLDHAGPLAESVEDATLLYHVMAGRRDPRSATTEALRGPVAGLRLGVPSFVRRDLDPEVAVVFQGALAVLAEAGMEHREVEVPELEGALQASAVIAGAEALAVHGARIRERPGDFDPVVLARLEKGYALTAVELARALAHRDDLAAAYARVFREVDLMAAPTLPGLPPPVGVHQVRVGGGREEWVVDAFCRFMAPQNMTGAPALSVPCGFSAGGLPMGLQLWGPPRADARVLAAGHAFQLRTDWHKRRPPPLRP